MSVSLTELLEQVENKKIVYCSWKNNHLYDEVIACEKDLDIYVPLRQKNEFLSVLYDNGFIEAGSGLSSYPFVHHYYAPCDKGMLLHLHVYFRLMTGESHLKDYWLPLESQLEDRRVRNDKKLYVPDDECQRLIYILRHYLKKSSLLGLIMHWRERKDYNAEYQKIASVSLDKEKIAVIDSDLIKVLDLSLEKAGIARTWLLGMCLRRRLNGLRRLGACRAFVERYVLMLRRIINKIFFGKKKTLHGGGRFIAITGLDGSGKSSIINAVSETLSKHFIVRKIHLGRPPATMLTFPVRALLMLRKRIVKTRELISNTKDVQVRPTGIVKALRFAVLAYERKCLAIRAFRDVCNGEIVISDRYPSTTVGKMDSPKIAMDGAKWLVKKLGRFEKGCYQNMAQPDLLIELFVPFEVALERNRLRNKSDKETKDELRERYDENTGLEYRVTRHVRINNDQPFDEARQQMLNLVWKIFI